MSHVLCRVGRWSIEWKPADCWIGAYWQRGSFETWHRQGIDNPALPAIAYSFDLWLCIIPMLPIHYSRSQRRA